MSEAQIVNVNLKIHLNFEWVLIISFILMFVQGLHHPAARPGGKVERGYASRYHQAAVWKIMFSHSHESRITIRSTQMASAILLNWYWCHVTIQIPQIVYIMIQPESANILFFDYLQRLLCVGVLECRIGRLECSFIGLPVCFHQSSH